MILCLRSLALAATALACQPGGGADPGASADPDRMLASGMTARQVIEARALHFKDLGGSFKAVRDQLATASPNPSLVRLATQEVKYASDDLPGWFPAGTGPETGVEMRAFAEVWSDSEGFAEISTRFRESAAALHATAQDDDLDAARSQVRAVGEACKDCHDRYRAEED